MDRTAKDPANVKGWGVDADPKNDPTYPMKHRTDGEHAGYSWERPPQQPPTVEVLRSIERSDLTSAFGTSTPPTGASGALRRFAFRYSESSYGHWLPLMLADRVGVAEGFIEDLKGGRFPNIFAERGLGAEWQHNRTGLIQRALVRGVLVAAAVRYLRRRGSR